MDSGENDPESCFGVYIFLIQISEKQRYMRSTCHSGMF